MIFYNERYGLIEITFYDYDHFCIILSDNENEYYENYDFFQDNYEFIGFI
jgi:hypothetical protein